MAKDLKDQWEFKLYASVVAEYARMVVYLERHPGQHMQSYARGRMQALEAKYPHYRLNGK